MPVFKTFKIEGQKSVQVTRSNKPVVEAKKSHISPFDGDYHVHSGADLPKITQTQVINQVISLSSLSATFPLSFNSGTGVISMQVGSANQVLGVNNAGTAMQYRTLQGTSNQVIITPSGAALVFSTPQDIATTSSPTFSNVTLSSRTSGRVAYFGASGIFTDDADFTFDGSQLSLAVQGSSGGIMLGGDSLLYRSAADRLFTPDSLYVDITNSTGAGINATLFRQRLTAANTNFPTSMGAQTTINAGSGAITYATAMTGINEIDTTHTGTVNNFYGLDFVMRHNSTSGANVSNWRCIAVGNTSVAGSTGTIDSLRAISVDLSFSTSAPAHINDLIGYRFSAPGVPAGGIDNIIGIRFITPVTGAGVVTNHITLQSQALIAFSANNQSRVGIQLAATPDPGAFTGTTALAIDIQGTSRATRDGIRFAGDAEAILYSGASDRIDVTGGFEAVNDVRGRQFIADGDNAGVASTTSLTNATDTNSATPATITQRTGGSTAANASWIKVYVGTAARYIPVWD